MKRQVMLQTRNLCHLYRNENGEELLALDNINLTFSQGEFVAVIGRNGSGKSTLAKHLNALLSPSSGQCIVDGMDTLDSAKVWEIRQKVGMVFQNPDNQIVASIVEEDIAFGPENLGLPAEEIVRRVEEALRLVDMTDYRLHGPHLLSGGKSSGLLLQVFLPCSRRAWCWMNRPPCLTRLGVRKCWKRFAGFTATKRSRWYLLRILWKKPSKQTGLS